MKSKLLLLSIATSLLTNNLSAKGPVADTAGPRLRKFYWASNTDGGIFSTAFIKTPDPTNPTTTKNTMGTLRFSWVLNLGASFNYNINDKIGLFTGLNLRNIGFISKSAGVTTKTRTYNLGIPLGIKFGDMRPKRTYGFVGGGVDFPFHFKQKVFTDRKNKTKTTDWFSDRTPVIMPYVFAGVAINRGLTFKLQYYPGNFVNQDFILATPTGNIKPYAATEANVLMLSLGYSMPFSKEKDMMKKKVEELQDSDKSKK